MVNANAPVTPVPPVPATETTNTVSGTTAASGHGFRAKTVSRSSPKTASRLHNVSRPSPAAAAVTAKQNQSKEQAEKKNQAITQLRKLLVQGNKRVEALATVIQHLFTEVLQSFLWLPNSGNILTPPASILYLQILINCVTKTQEGVLHIVILASILLKCSTLYGCVINTEGNHTVLLFVIMFLCLGKLAEVL